MERICIEVLGADGATGYWSDHDYVRRVQSSVRYTPFQKEAMVKDWLVLLAADERKLELQSDWCAARQKYAVAKRVVARLSKE